MKLYLYKFDDGSVDENGQSNAIFLLSSYTEERDLRSDMGVHDHGGMSYEIFERVWQEGKLEKVTNASQVPDCWLDCYPFETAELGSFFEHDVSEFLAKMDENGLIEF